MRTSRARPPDPEACGKRQNHFAKHRKIARERKEGRAPYIMPYNVQCCKELVVVMPLTAHIFSTVRLNSIFGRCNCSKPRVTLTKLVVQLYVGRHSPSLSALLPRSSALVRLDVSRSKRMAMREYRGWRKPRRQSPKTCFDLFHFKFFRPACSYCLHKFRTEVHNGPPHDIWSASSIHARIVSTSVSVVHLCIDHRIVRQGLPTSH